MSMLGATRPCPTAPPKPPFPPQAGREGAEHPGKGTEEGCAVQQVLAVQQHPAPITHFASLHSWNWSSHSQEQSQSRF